MSRPLLVLAALCVCSQASAEELAATGRVTVAALGAWAQADLFWTAAGAEQLEDARSALDQFLAEEGAGLVVTRLDAQSVEDAGVFFGLLDTSYHNISAQFEGDRDTLEALAAFLARELPGASLQVRWMQANDDHARRRAYGDALEQAEANARTLAATLNVTLGERTKVEVRDVPPSQGTWTPSTTFVLIDAAREPHDFGRASATLTVSATVTYETRP